MKFHGHTIRFENFTKDLARHSTKKSTNDQVWKKIHNQMENSMINSEKIHTQTRHVRDHSCKI